MRATILLALLLVASMTCVLATSPPNCAGVVCATAGCKSVTCKCGNYKDACGCCDICYKCPEEACVPLHQDRCSSGHSCKLNDPKIDIFQGAQGICKPEAHAHHT